MNSYSKFLRYSVLTALIALLFAMLGCGSGGESSGVYNGGYSADEGYSYTILVYMEGTDLEEKDALMTGNIKEMLAATPSDKIVVLLTTGAANKDNAKSPDDPVTSWKTVKRHIIENGTIKELHDLDNIDMGSSAQLTDFIVWGQINYPADRYILVLSDHGGGALGGFGTTMTNPKLTPLSITDIRKGIADAVAVTGRKLEIIGFDACLMATIEVAYAFKDYANYLAASEDIEPGTGWAWTDLLNYIAANPSADGIAIGRNIADKYLDKMKKDSDDAAITFSITDLSKVQAVATALASFASWQQGLLVNEGITAWTNLARARSRSLDFYTASLTMRFTDMVDTVDMIDSEDLQSPQTTALVNAVDKAVIYKVAGRLRSNARGLSLMFPTGNVWYEDQINIYKSLPFVPEYQNLVESFSAFARDKVPDKIISDPAMIGKTMTSNFTPADAYYEQAYVCMSTTSSGVTSIYGHQPIWPSSPGKLEYSWDDSWYTLNGFIVSALAEPSTEPVVTLRIPLEVDNEKGVYYLIYNYINHTAEMIGFLRNVQNELTNYPYKGFEQLKPGAVVKPLVYKLDNKNWLDNTWVTGTSTFTIPSSGLLFAKTVLVSGTYDIGFTVDDLRIKPSFSNLITFTK